MARDYKSIETVPANGHYWATDGVNEALFYRRHGLEYRREAWTPTHWAQASPGEVADIVGGVLSVEVVH